MLYISNMYNFCQSYFTRAGKDFLKEYSLERLSQAYWHRPIILIIQVAEAGR